MIAARVHPGLAVLAVVAGVTAALLILQDVQHRRSTITAPAPALSAAQTFAGERECFTPGEDCTAMIVQAINGTQSELLIQAYGFTSEPIIEAVVKAKERGVQVKIILDKINEQERYTAATFLANHGIEPLIDYTVRIAHNKVMVLDRRDVITGSFNFTVAAQQRNAENVLFVLDKPEVADAYAREWQSRAEQSRPYRDFRSTMEKAHVQQ